jgi:hypothetical protein
MGHPWPANIPSSWLGQLPSNPVDYRLVVPDRVVELDVDTAFERTGGATERGSSESAQTCNPKTFWPRTVPTVEGPEFSLVGGGHRRGPVGGR